MKIIKTMVDFIEEELEGAKQYAMLAVELKESEPTVAAMLIKMAQDELGHATMIHTEAVKLIEKQKAVSAPPVVMQEMWSIAHKYYIEHAAATKAMIELFGAKTS